MWVNMLSNMHKKAFKVDRRLLFLDMQVFGTFLLELLL